MMKRWRTAAIALAASGAFFAGFVAASADEPRLETAILAGGCFWCVESDFEKVDGVVDAVSGYTGGTAESADYKTVVSGTTKHLEAVKITYDADKIAYEEILRIFWRSIDPTDAGGQFCDRGASYATAIFAVDDRQAEIAKASRAAIEKAGILPKPIVTPVVEAGAFYPAEGYHQDYYKKNPYRYKLYRFSCRRDSRIEELWGDEAWGGKGQS